MGILICADTISMKTEIEEEKEDKKKKSLKNSALDPSQRFCPNSILDNC